MADLLAVEPGPGLSNRNMIMVRVRVFLSVSPINKILKIISIAK